MLSIRTSPLPLEMGSTSSSSSEPCSEDELEDPAWKPKYVYVVVDLPWVFTLVAHGFVHRCICGRDPCPCGVLDTLFAQKPSAQTLLDAGQISVDGLT